jgi:hypothetical protein
MILRLDHPVSLFYIFYTIRRVQFPQLLHRYDQNLIFYPVQVPIDDEYRSLEVALLSFWLLLLFLLLLVVILLLVLVLVLVMVMYLSIPHVERMNDRLAQRY